MSLFRPGIKRTVAPIIPEVPEFMPTGTLDRQIAQERRRMGEQRWAELNREWL